MSFLYVGLGGFCGAIARYSLGLIVKSTQLPMGTLLANLLGCFFIGLMMGFGEGRNFFGSHKHLFLVVGLLGGFTTFSSFSFETIQLLRNSQIALALTNVFVQVLCGLLFTILGFQLAFKMQ